MARKPKNKTYEVTITGDYFAATTGGTELKPYSVTINMSEEHRLAGFLSVFKNILAPRVMPTKYEKYTGLATHRIAAVKDHDDPNAIPPDPKLMTLPQLTAFISKNELPVNVSLYKDEDQLKRAVIDCLRDEDSFIEAQDKRKDIYGGQIEMANELAALNPGLGMVGLQVPDNIAENVDLTNIPEADAVKIPNKKVNHPANRPESDETVIDATKKTGEQETNDDDAFNLDEL